MRIHLYAILVLTFTFFITIQIFKRIDNEKKSISEKNVDIYISIFFILTVIQVVFFIYHFILLFIKLV